MADNGDIQVLRELAREYRELFHKEVQDERRDLWRRHNSLKRTRPLIYARWGAAAPEIIYPHLVCEDPFYRGHEIFLRQMIFQDQIGDDYILEPWITQRASYVTPPDGPWGPKVETTPLTMEGGSFKVNSPIKELADISKLAKPQHKINEEETERNVSRLRDAVGDIIEVNVDRGPLYTMWHGDISTDLAYLRGLEQVMWDMHDNPKWLHEVLAFMRDGILETHEQAERAGDWRLANHQNQAMAYAEELRDPCANSGPVKRAELWVFAAAQELTLVSPEMHDEFMLRYQIPIMEKFGLAAYGCCEDLTHKIDIVRKIPNLRRIGVTPRADVVASADQIGEDYVFSWRPNPAEMVCCGFDADHVRKVVGNAMEAAKGCHVDITLKDVQTVENEPDRLRKWVEVVREISDNY